MFVRNRNEFFRTLHYQRLTKTLFRNSKRRTEAHVNKGPPLALCCVFVFFGVIRVDNVKESKYRMRKNLPRQFKLIE